MTRRVACVSWAVLLTGVWLAGTSSVLAQAAAEAAGAAAAASAAGGATARATGQTIGSVLGRTAAKVETSTQTATPVASTGAKSTRGQGAASGSTRVTPARISADAGGAQPGTFTVLGPQPQIHFDVVSFKRCAGVGSSEVDLPTDGDYVAYHCQPLFRIIYFAYTGATGLNFKLIGYPSWVETDLYDFEAKVAGEDIATWQEMGLSARRVAVRQLLAEELKLKIHVDTTPKPGKAEVDGIVVDHIERPAAD
jgi:Protein of unknown function (DUF3738)